MAYRPSPVEITLALDAMLVTLRNRLLNVMRKTRSTYIRNLADMVRDFLNPRVTPDFVDEIRSIYVNAVQTRSVRDAYNLLVFTRRATITKNGIYVLKLLRDKETIDSSEYALLVDALAGY